MPAAPNSRPLRHWTRPARAWVMVLTVLVTPTTRRDVAIALFGIHAGDVGQQRHHQDGAAATQQAQRYPDDDGERNSQRDHGDQRAVRAAIHLSVCAATLRSAPPST